ncbi:MAG TPA: preprotein translocase subunit SecE [Solirubrobacteraceae bacterium]|nr:preprotein translocase subunit SecE [Solirubrobacteraceae bacterium]
MARNRQRAKDRKQKLHRENIPGSLDHASGEVEEVEARIVAGAAGVPVDSVDMPDDSVELEDDFDAGTVEDARLGRGAGDLGGTAAAPPHKGGPRLINFFRACIAELKRVDWPDRRQVGQATAVVLGFVVVAGAFLGLMDVISQKIVDLIL